MSEKTFEGWAILELMGHRRLAGHVQEVEIAGTGFLRLDVYAGDDPDAIATQFYSAGSLYCLTPSSEDVCRRYGLHARPQPVARWELEPPREYVPRPGSDDDPPDSLDEMEDGEIPF